MLDIINITAPIFIIIALGYLSVRTHLIDPRHAKGMGALVMTIALPALMFNAIADMPFQEVISPSYLLIYAIGSIMAFVIGVIITKGFWHQDNVTAALNSTALAYSNSADIASLQICIVV